MGIVDKIKSFLQEAELYRSQGLLNEAESKYKDAAEIIQKNEQLKGREKLLNSIAKKLQTLQSKIDQIEKAEQTPELSAEVQELIKNKFSFASDKDEVTLEGAIALSKFGQFKAALKDFNELIKIDSHRIVAAKNIIRCHISLDSIDYIVTQYQQWLSSDMFTPEQLDNLRNFINGILIKKGIDKTIPLPTTPAGDTPAEIEAPELEALKMEAPEVEIVVTETTEIDAVEIEKPSIEIQGIEIHENVETGIQDEDLVDVNSIGITLEKGPREGELIEFDISIHSGKEITVIIPSKEKEVIDILKPGFKLNNVQFYTPFAMITGPCIVESNTKLGTGPRKGDHTLDLKVIST